MICIYSANKLFAWFIDFHSKRKRKIQIREKKTLIKQKTRQEKIYLISIVGLSRVQKKNDLYKLYLVCGKDNEFFYFLIILSTNFV